ncbi:hypothetical protein EYF80_029378 [Liparis tanakae]|uniref:Uncharacterized protein n=1 Tax=Liparis tanakae TaxID=230148 RepID=A0A4Z2H3R7_9TELE|nr:hypothetical protein EYF80_029378 [Liparis tanakae]
MVRLLPMNYQELAWAAAMSRQRFEVREVTIARQQGVARQASLREEDDGDDDDQRQWGRSRAAIRGRHNRVGLTSFTRVRAFSQQTLTTQHG